MIHPEVTLQLPDSLFGSTSAKPVVVFDRCCIQLSGGNVGDDRVEPKPVEIVEGELCATASWLTAHDQPECSPGEGEGAFGDMASNSPFRAPGAPPAGLRVGGQVVNRLDNSGIWGAVVVK